MNKEKPNKDMDWANEADAERHTSEWFGAILRYFWYLGKRKFDDLYTREEMKRNVRAGWLFRVFIVLVIFFIGYLSVIAG